MNRANTAIRQSRMTPNDGSSPGLPPEIRRPDDKQYTSTTWLASGRLILASRFEDARRASNVILHAAQRLDFDRNSILAIKLALDEALANAINHGNHQDPAKRITVDYQIDAREARITVQDEGNGFDPDTVPDPTLDENQTLSHGRGLMLMRVYMDDVIYDCSGSRVALVKSNRTKDRYVHNLRVDERQRKR